MMDNRIEVVKVRSEKPYALRLVLKEWCDSISKTRWASKEAAQRNGAEYAQRFGVPILDKTGE